MIYKISEGLDYATPTKSTKFTQEKILERAHIQEWIRKDPTILGEDLLILTMEFNKFKNSNDRLDLLAVDREGNLVVIELKRDEVAGHADLQAIRYAAMVSSMTLEIITPYYIDYRERYYNEELTPEDALNRIVSFIENDDFVEFSDKPRIILCSEGFSPEITATVLWLRNTNVDISCISIAPYKVGDDLFIVPTKIIPVKETEQYLIDIKQKEEKVVRTKGSVRKNTMQLLLDSDIIKPGDKIYLRHALPSHLTFDKDDATFVAELTGDSRKSVRWEKDGEAYSITALTKKIFSTDWTEWTGRNGNWHWTNESGTTLWHLAETHVNND